MGRIRKDRMEGQGNLKGREARRNGIGRIKKEESKVGKGRGKEKGNGKERVKCREGGREEREGGR